MQTVRWALPRVAPLPLLCGCAFLFCRALSADLSYCPPCSHCPCPHAGKEQRIGNRTEIALLELAMLLGGQPRHLRSQQRQVTQASATRLVPSSCLLPACIAIIENLS
jgi:hypothetical protein